MSGLFFRLRILSILYLNICRVLVMDVTESCNIQCPHCWEVIELIIDCTQERQEYIEDCSVCCQPMTIHVEIKNSGEILLDVEQAC